VFSGVSRSLIRLACGLPVDPVSARCRQTGHTKLQGGPVPKNIFVAPNDGFATIAAFGSSLLRSVEHVVSGYKPVANERAKGGRVEIVRRKSSSHLAMELQAA
jgi:hypothetical protein